MKARTKYYITAAMLVEKEACSAQVQRFRRLFGRGRVVLTPANVLKALDGGLSVVWPAWLLFVRAPVGSTLQAQVREMTRELRQIGAHFSQGDKAAAIRAHTLLRQMASLYNKHRKELSPW